MPTKRLLFLVVLIASTSTISFAGLINPISASVDLSMSSDAGCGSVSDSSSQAWGTPLNPLTAMTDALATCTHPNRKVETSGKLTAKWNNAKSGTIKFKNIGWKVNNNVTSGAANANLGTDYSYTFSPNKDVWFDLSYDISSTGDLNGFGLNGFYVSLGTSFTALPINTSGDLLYFLNAGDTYTLSIVNGANISGGIAGLTEYMDGTFKFKATATTPEPSSLILLGGGVLGLAGTLRKKLRA